MISSRFPPELLFEIFRYVKLKDLPAICLTNRPLNVIATHVLYKSIKLKKMEDIISCCYSISVNPTAAKCVRNLDIKLDFEPSVYTVLPLNHAIRLALTKTLRLENLSLFLAPTSEELYCSGTFSRLYSFCCDATPVTSKTSDFLELHSTLVHVLFCPDDEPIFNEINKFTLSDAALPRLTSYMGPRELAPLIVPGRPVTHCSLRWYSDIHTPDASIYPAFEALSKSSRQMQAVNCIISHWVGPWLDAATKYLPGIQSLHLAKENGLHRLLGLDDSIQYKDFIQTVPSHLEKFQNLQQVAFQQGPGHEFGNQVEDEGCIVHGWSKSFPTLVLITLRSGLTWRVMTRDLCIPDLQDPRSLSWLLDHLKECFISLTKHRRENRGLESGVEFVDTAVRMCDMFESFTLRNWGMGLDEMLAIDNWGLLDEEEDEDEEEEDENEDEEEDENEEDEEDEDTTDEEEDEDTADEVSTDEEEDKSSEEEDISSQDSESSDKSVED
ncbi:hypothetical protein K439DRAFT_322924 [Ramaria rubella]|nr:hypothetical protein K439DRAFT_322924 [Ramaria rubella]